MAPKGSQGGIGMWPPSESLATSIYDAANIALIFALVVGVGATALVVWMGNIKEEYLKRAVADAQARAAEANLALAKFKAPRRLSSAQQALFVAKLKPFSGTEYDLSAKDPEPLDFALDIADVLTTAGWKVQTWTDSEIVTTLPKRSFAVGTVVLSGVDVQIRDPNLSAARDALVDVLTLSGFEGVRGSFASVSPESPGAKVMHIMIGTKQ